MKKILLVEDDRDYAEIVQQLLEEVGYRVDVVYTAIDGLNKNKEIEYDLVITDLHLDSLNGMQVAELIKRDTPNVYIMMLTASVLDEDESKALYSGVDEYVRKSVSFSILLSRIDHLFSQRARETQQLPMLQSAKERLSVDLTERIVLKDEVEVPLTLLEYELLVCFLENKNKLLSRQDILKKVWKVEKEEANVDVRIIDTYIKNIRKKLNVTSIYSIRGIGYRWHEN